MLEQRPPSPGVRLRVRPLAPFPLRAAYCWGMFMYGQTGNSNYSRPDGMPLPVEGGLLWESLRCEAVKSGSSVALERAPSRRSWSVSAAE